MSSNCPITYHRPPRTFLNACCDSFHIWDHLSFIFVSVFLLYHLLLFTYKIIPENQNDFFFVLHLSRIFVNVQDTVRYSIALGQFLIQYIHHLDSENKVKQGNGNYGVFPMSAQQIPRNEGLNKGKHMTCSFVFLYWILGMKKKINKV